MLDTVVQWLTGLPLHTRILLGFATTVVAIELLLRYAAPKSPVYRVWSKGFQRIGEVWTAVILSVIYVLAVGPVSLIMRFGSRDLLDRKIGEASSVWRDHEPNPLGPTAAARHQF